MQDTRRREIFTSFCDAPTTHNEPQKEGSVDGVPVISKRQDFITAVMNEVVVEFDSAHMEFVKL